MSQSLAELGEIAKAMPRVGALTSKFKPYQSAFARGTKGKKMSVSANPASTITAGQVRANRAGQFANKYRTPLIAVGAGGAAGAGAGFAASRVDKAFAKPLNLKTHFLDGSKKMTRQSRKQAARKAPALAAANPNTAANPFGRMNMDMGMKPVPNPFTGGSKLM